MGTLAKITLSGILSYKVKFKYCTPSLNKKPILFFEVAKTSLNQHTIVEFTLVVSNLTWSLNGRLEKTGRFFAHFTAMKRSRAEVSYTPSGLDVIKADI